MKLVSVSSERAATGVLFELLLERPPHTWISTKRLATEEEHRRFVSQHPYFAWYLIEVAGEYVGSIYLGHDNSIGVAILRAHQRRGYGSQAVKLLMRQHEPLPGKASVRNASFIANIAPGNAESIKFFAKLGFRHIQNVYAHE